MNNQFLNHIRYAVLLVLFLVLSYLFTDNVSLASETAADSHPTRLVIPQIALDSSVIPVDWKPIEVNGQTYGQWNVDDHLVGWHNLSAPLGQPGNTVLNGHSNVYGKVFHHLKDVEVGQELTVYSNLQPYHYLVTEKILVQEKGVSLQERIENAKLIMPTEDERLTLITCARSEATHRLVIIARPVQP